MSHIPHRKEKDCLNCGAIVQGPFCQECGQENVIPKETFWHMVTHFFYDITHFDSSFFHTVHHLVFKPGFLTREYMLGRRMRYLHPIRMYVFSSAMFFLLFFSVFKTGNLASSINEPLNPQQRAEYIERLQNELQKDTGNALIKSQLILARDTSHRLTANDVMRTGENGVIITFTDKNYRTVEEYDSIEQTLPSSERDGWIMRRLVKKQIEINTKYKDNPGELANEFAKSVLHRLPYMLFVSLPLFALILKLVYIRRKKFFYADHGVFTIHLYVFTFILLMLVFGLDKLNDLTGWKIWGTIIGLMFVALFAYLLIAMKRFYGQGWGKTIIKFLIVSILSLIMMLILLLFFMFFSAVTF